ncbi:hypothetical protein F943_02874 [Acinetobacter ursingii NIPH 706]|nr:hypothetical protein F943_02874 [Acinetobacter ursingii NIPH 706]
MEYVHGDIRHLESESLDPAYGSVVHGDIRHLESESLDPAYGSVVHGDIRHLEIIDTWHRFV